MTRRNLQSPVTQHALWLPRYTWSYLRSLLLTAAPGGHLVDEPPVKTLSRHFGSEAGSDANKLSVSASAPPLCPSSSSSSPLLLLSLASRGVQAQSCRRS